MRDNKVNVLKKMLGMLMIVPVALSLSLFAVEPIHHWELDETTGPTYEDTGIIGDANGTCTLPDGCPASTDGQIYGAQSFDGNDTISIQNTLDFDWAADANATIEFWMNSNANVSFNDNDIMIGRATDVVKWYVGIAPNGLIRAAINDGVFQGVTGSKVINDGKWYHIAYVLKPGMVKVYVNGENDFNITRGMATSLACDTNVTVGNLDYTVLPDHWGYTGELDDIKLYATDLNGSTIKQHYEDGLKPHLREVVPVPTPTNNDTPNYTFSSDKNGTITYGDLVCASDTNLTAVKGNNTITFNTLPDGNYTDCTITVTSTEAATDGNVSEPLLVSNFVIDTTVQATTDTTNGGGGGGCTYNPDNKNFDMMFLLMMALGLFYPFRRRFIK